MLVHYGVFCTLNVMFEQFLREMIGGSVDHTSSLFWLDRPLWNMNHYSLAKANDEKKSASFRKDVEDSFLLYPQMRVSINFHIMGYLENFWYKASYQSTNHLEKIFNWVSKEIWNCFAVFQIYSVICPENSRHLLNQSVAKLKTIAI